MLLTTEARWCAVCAAESVFDRFDCDDHGPDCLELVCSACGTGLELVGAGLVEVGVPSETAGPAKVGEVAA